MTSHGNPDAEELAESDPLEAAEDGIAPLITNTGDDVAADADGADAPTG